MINISPCKKSDYEVLTQIEKSIFQEPMSNNELKIFEKQASYKIWKIEEKKIVGFVSFFHVKDEIEIIKIGIIKTHQRNNYGSIIIDEIKRLNIKKIFLEVSVQNINAINFYLKNGFQKIGVRKGYYVGKDNSRIDALRLIFKF